MPSKLCILGCHNFHQELQASIAAEGWNDAVAVPFPARCGRPPLEWDELRALLPPDCNDVVVVGRACLKNLGHPPADFPPVRVEQVTQCFHLVASAATVSEAMTGGYLITPAWLADWRGHLRSMGFAPEQASEFFRDFARELVLFDSGLDPQTDSRLQEFQEIAGLPARRIAAGLDHTRVLLTRWVLERRLASERKLGKERNRQLAGQLADHAAAMDTLARLARTLNETEAISAIETCSACCSRQPPCTI